MPARTGKQFLDRLRRTTRQLWVEGARVDDVTAHPALAGGAQTIASIFDRQHAFPDDCLTPDPETGEPVNIAATSVPKFRAGAEFKKHVSGK